MAFSFDLILAFSVDPVAAILVEPEQNLCYSYVILVLVLDDLATHPLII